MKHMIITAAALTAFLTPAYAQTQTQTQTRTQTETQSITAHATASAPAASIRTAAQMNAALSGPGTVALKTSQIALDKASQDKVKEFAQFETDEQTTVGAILKELNTPAAVMTDKDNMTLQKLQAVSGAAFDRAYIMAQIDGHQTLLSIVESYLSNADQASRDPMEMNARHMAMLMRSTIKQHLTQAKEMQQMMK